MEKTRLMMRCTHGGCGGDCASVWLHDNTRQVLAALCEGHIALLKRGLPNVVLSDWGAWQEERPDEAALLVMDYRFHEGMRTRDSEDGRSKRAQHGTCSWAAPCGARATHLWETGAGQPVGALCETHAAKARLYFAGSRLACLSR